MGGTPQKIKQSIARVIDSGTHVSVASSTQFIAKKLGLSERWVNYTHVEIRNKLNELKYRRVPFNERILFLPHCLKHSKKCNAEYNHEGLQCKSCGNCKISELEKMAKERDYGGVYVCPGGSLVIKLVEKHKPKAVLGVCCFEEAQLVFDKLKGSGVAAQAVLLSKDGCVDTDVNVEEVREKMDLIEKNKKE